MPTHFINTIKEFDVTKKYDIPTLIGAVGAQLRNHRPYTAPLSDEGRVIMSHWEEICPILGGILSELAKKKYKCELRDSPADSRATFYLTPEAVLVNRHLLTHADCHRLFGTVPCGRQAGQNQCIASQIKTTVTAQAAEYFQRTPIVVYNAIHKSYGAETGGPEASRSVVSGFTRTPMRRANPPWVAPLLCSFPHVPLRLHVAQSIALVNREFVFEQKPPTKVTLHSPKPKQMEDGSAFRDVTSDVIAVTYDVIIPRQKSPAFRIPVPSRGRKYRAANLRVAGCNLVSSTKLEKDEWGALWFCGILRPQSIPITATVSYNLQVSSTWTEAKKATDIAFNVPEFKVESVGPFACLPNIANALSDPCKAFRAAMTYACSYKDDLILSEPADGVDSVLHSISQQSGDCNHTAYLFFRLCCYYGYPALLDLSARGEHVVCTAEIVGRFITFDPPSTKGATRHILPPTAQGPLSPFYGQERRCNNKDHCRQCSECDRMPSVVDPPAVMAVVSRFKDGIAAEGIATELKCSETDVKGILDSMEKYYPIAYAADTKRYSVNRLAWSAEEVGDVPSSAEVRTFLALVEG